MSPRRRNDTSSVSAPGQPPRFVGPCAVLTALAVAAAAALIFVVIRESDVADARRQATDRARFAARSVLAPELRAADLVGLLSHTRRRQLDQLLERRVLPEGIGAATLYGPGGRRLYAMAGRDVSSDGTPERIREALAGVTVSEISHGALRTYVPIAVPGGKVRGVARLDQDDGPIAASARRSSLLIAAVLEGLLVLLFLVLVPVLARASARIRAQVAELEQVALRDELTRLPNRYGFRRLAGEALRGRVAAAILLVDLDGFSEINGSLGPESGDLLLVDAAQRLEGELSGEGALVARLGEDEFGILHAAADGAEANRIAERIRRSFAPPFDVDGVRVAVDVDVGVALYPAHGDDVETLLGRASSALVAAKEEGRSCVQVYDPSFGAADSCRLAVVAELRDALAEGQLRVFYQPQADLLTHQIRGVEALVRWQHPERGLLAADEFVVHGERGGLAQELRRFVLATAARQWEEWRSVGIELELAVNLSAVDMLDPALSYEIEDVTSRHAMPPWNLVLEVTERTLVGDERRAQQVAERLGRIGVRLSVDDFGTGYSSLGSLRRFPIQQVKLDRSLLADVPGDEAAEAIVEASVEIAHGLGALVVAEGIETLTQWRYASIVGCDIAQGYLVGKPVPPELLVELVEAPRLAPLSVA